MKLIASAILIGSILVVLPIRVQVSEDEIMQEIVKLKEEMEKKMRDVAEVELKYYFIIVNGYLG